MKRNEVVSTYPTHEDVVCWRCGLPFSKQPHHDQEETPKHITEAEFLKICSRCGEYTFYNLEKKA